ncbi:MAG: TolC family protein [Paludibacteraceae bacterium]|nr:TolC family protein [Paludibacteraceae bacterium]
MKTKNIAKQGAAVLLSLLSLSPVVAQEQLTTKGDTIHLTLDQAIKIALDQNPTVVIDSMEVLRTTYAKKETLGNLYPQIAFAGSVQYAIKKQTISMAGRSLQMGSAFTTSVGFNAGMPLINVPLWKSIALTEESINSKREEARQTKINMVSTITEAYYQLLNAKDSYKVLQSSWNTANENLRITRVRFQNGMCSEYDTIQADVQVKSIEPSMIATKRGIELATLNLKIQMGLPDDYPVTIDGTLADYERSMFDEIKLNDIDTALSDNPTMRKLDVTERLLQKQLEVTKAQWYPTLSLSAMYNWISMGEKFTGNDWNPYSTIGLSLNFPLFQGGSRYYKQKEAELQYKEMQFTKEDTKRKLKLGLQSSLNNLRVAIETINTTKAAAASAWKGLTIAQKRYEVGSGTTLELTSSQNALTAAQLNYLQAIYDYIVAKNNVDEVLGNAYNNYIQ